MFKFLRYFKDSRKKVIIILVCILVIIYALIKLFNYAKKEEGYSEDNSSSSNDTTAIVTNSNENNDNNDNNLVKVDTSEDAIKKFVNFCNSGNVKDAYKMLTSECKESLYNTEEKFSNNYVKKIFDKERSYQIVKWSNINENCEVYKITFSEDPIISGKLGENNGKQDYISIIRDSETYKLSVSGFIKKENMTSEKKNNYLQINVLNRLVFVDYELYTIKVKNIINVDFTLDDMKDNTKTYIEDSDGTKFKIINDEYTSETSRVPNDKEKEMTLKFDRKYTSDNKNISKIVFSRISILNRNYYQEVYNTVDNSVNYEEKMSTYPAILSMEINL